MANDCIPLSVVSNFASKDTNRLVGRIAEVLALKSPWMDILEGGTMTNVSDTVRSVVQERAVLASSLVAPEFISDISMCGAGADPDQVGSTEYSYSLGTLRGRGPRVCVKVARTAFQDAYLRAQQSLEKGILQITNADIRNSLYTRSGVKFVCRNDKSFDQLISGDSQEIDTQFNNLVPNTPISFKTLWRLSAFLREEMLAEPFETETGTMFKFIGSVEIIERLRNELDVKEDLLALVSGKYQIGEKSINSYAFSGPYRNIAFGIDQQPMRCDGFDANGQPVLIEPEVSKSVTNGVGSRRNPAWVAAKYEIGFLIGSGSFKRLIPERYVGEGSFKFAPQLFGGELEWVNDRDWDCNLWRDYGQHIYQIQRAYQPMRPHAIIPILFQRCNYDLGLATCSSSITGL